MSFWTRLRAALTSRGAPPNARHLQAMAATLADLRRSVAVLEAAEAWWTERRRRTDSELFRWERRLQQVGYDAELRSRVSLIVRTLERDSERIWKGMMDATEAVRRGEDQLSTCMTTLTVERRKAEAYRYDTSGLGLDARIDEHRIREDADRSFRATIPEDPADDERVFLDRLFANRESSAFN